MIDRQERKAIALGLAARGLWLFRVRPGRKVPAQGGWQAEVTRDAAAIAAWVDEGFNLGISTSRCGDGAEAIVAIDCDNKGDKHGDVELDHLEHLQGRDLPPTLEHRTPTGGRHILYRHSEALPQGVDVLARGLDIRSKGGLLVAPGSNLADIGDYTILHDRPIAPAPRWVVEILTAKAAQHAAIRASGRGVEGKPGKSAGSAEDRVAAYLASALVAVAGSGGNDQTYKAACGSRDRGACEIDALTWMHELYNPRCQPPWSYDELGDIVAHAFSYGQNKAGSKAPENVFAKIVLPWTTEELLGENLGPVRWIIPGLLPEGLTMLMAKQKVGKSWMVLQWLLACTTGGAVFGKFKCEEPVEALYLALEDNKRRFGARLRELGAEPDRRFHYRLEWKRLDLGGLEDLETFLAEHPACKIIVIDTIQRVKPRSGNGDAYQNDVAAMAPLQNIAKDRGIAVVVVHHERKPGSADGDWMDSSTGSLGMPATSDTIFRIARKRGAFTAKLQREGHDLEDTADLELYLQDGYWLLADEPTATAEEQQEARHVADVVLAAVRDGITSPKAIAEKIGRKANHVTNELAKLARAGRLKKVAHGNWQLPTPRNIFEGVASS